MRYFAIFLLATLCAGANESTFRTFKDTQGREIQAKLTRVSGQDVYIERMDGLATKVDLSVFSKEDQTFIQAWERKQAIKDGGIEVRFTTEETEKSGWESNGGVRRKTWQSHYGVVLTNGTYQDLKNIRIEYLSIKFEDAIAAQKRSEGIERRITGTTKVPLLKARSEATANTEKFSMQETKLEPGYYWVGGGKKTSEDEMRGIWVRVYVGDILATEISKPENLMRKETWPTSSSF